MAKHIYCRHSFEIEVQFFDVDAMHIVWHGNYVKYLETARCAFLSAIGYDYNEMALKTPDRRWRKFRTASDLGTAFCAV